MKRTTVSQEKNQEVPVQARKSAEAFESREGPGILDILKFGSQAILKQVIEEEITESLGRESYARLKAGQSFRGDRNGYRKTTIDTPIGQVIYDRQRLAEAPDFKSAIHQPHMRRLSTGNCVPMQRVRKLDAM